MKKNKRPQSPKSNARVQRVQELRQGSTTSPHRSAADYRRKPKHVGRGWDE
jgi:hypothetical protein